MTGDAQLAPYTSWLDFASHLKHPESVINFIAAYGTHSSITSATTLAGQTRSRHRDRARQPDAPADRLAFLNGPAASTGLNASISGSAVSPSSRCPSADCSVRRSTSCSRTRWSGCRTAIASTTSNAPRDSTSSRSWKAIRSPGSSWPIRTRSTCPPTYSRLRAYTLEVDASRQFNDGVLAGPDGIVADDPQTPLDESADNLPGAADPVGTPRVSSPS